MAIADQLTTVDAAYCSLAYAESLNHLGTPFWLPRSECYVLRRPIPKTNAFDLIGPYPILSVASLPDLLADLREFRNDFVSFFAVIDPMRLSSIPELRTDAMVVQPYKEHFVCDLSQFFQDGGTATQRKNLKYAVARLECKEVSPEAFQHDFFDLYQSLSNRHGDLGFANLDNQSLAGQLRLPQSRLFVAQHEGQSVGAILVFVEGNVAYFHLSCYNPVGYECRAAYALMECAYRSLAASGVTWAHLGGAPDQPGSGLAEFKRRWSTEVRWAHTLQVILNSKLYDSLSLGKSGTNFPKYRNSGVSA